MNLVDLLDSNAADLPFTGDTDFEQQLRDRFDAYFQEASRLSSSDARNAAFLAILPDSKHLADKVIESLGHWLDAAPDLALDALSTGLSRLNSQVDKLTSQDVGAANTGPMFRARVADLGARLGLAEMFHIPFNLRDRVTTQRYSFPGLPCLYLGRSLYVCWEELGRPDLHRLWVTKLKVAPTKTIRVLDFGHRPAFIAAGLDQTYNGSGQGVSEAHATAYAALWPLIAGCSVKCNPSRQRSFVVEYVVPQLLLRWLVRRMHNGGANRLDGIRYFSTHIEDHNVGVAGMNYVFPAQTRSAAGFCPQLKAKFHMAPPANWQIATAGSQPPPYPSYNQVRFEFTPGWLEDYRFTVFSRVEGFLDGLQVQQVP